MGEELRSVLIGTAGLSAAAVGALILTVARGPLTSSAADLRAAVRLAAATIAVQFAHFAEEFTGGFHHRFPEQLGLAPWSEFFFVCFNLFWLIVWAIACRALAAGWRVGLAALWFLGIAGLVNGLAHPLLAARAGEYFPGLVTSPVLGALGFLLIRRLASVTRG